MIICTICARQGSKGIKDKNIKTLMNKPLLQHSLEQAQSTKCFDAIVFSSDSQQYLDLASKFESIHTVLRPLTLALDQVSKLGAIEHAVSSIEIKNKCTFTTIVDLDVTAPLRSDKDIQQALNLFHKSDCEQVVSACPARHSPYTSLVELSDNGFAKICKASAQAISRRQDSPKCYDLNGALFIWDRQVFQQKALNLSPKTLIYEMPPERSIDIDSELDFKIVELLLKEKLTS